ncbi:MAG: hypothetical protein ACXWC8_11775 [Limisphaerales bacterium]
MTQNSTSPGSTKQGNNRPEPGGNSPITLIAIVVGVIVIGAVAYKSMHKDAPLADTANASVAQTDTAQSTKSKVVEPKDPTASVAAVASSPSPAAPAPPTTATVAAPKPVVTGAAKDFVTSLAALDPKKGPVTKEQAEKWKQDLKSLVAQGNTAVPAIREFLDRNVELSYANVGGESLGHSSLRSSMIDALQQIGGPEAMGALLSTLQTTALPSELEQISKALDQSAPGQYRTDILTAARQTLDLATGGGLGKEDAAPLFSILEKWGDPSVTADLQKAASAYKYYPVIALANLPDGAGVDTLVNMAKDPNAPSTVPEMLGQLAPTSQKAMDELLDLARNNRLTPAVWQQVISLVSGDQYLFGDAAKASAANPGSNDCQFFHIEWNNQNFSKCRNPNFQADKSVAAMNQLLGVTTDPSIRTSIQDRIKQLQAGGK